MTYDVEPTALAPIETVERKCYIAACNGNGEYSLYECKEGYRLVSQQFDLIIHSKALISEVDLDQVIAHLRERSGSL